MPQLSRKKSRSAFWILLLCGAFLTIPMQLFGPWWVIVPFGCMLGFLFRDKVAMPFLAGFLALLFQWNVVAYLLDASNNSILSQRIAVLLSLPGGSNSVILLTGILGGLLMGSAQLSGSLFGKLFFPKANNNYY